MLYARVAEAIQLSLETKVPPIAVCLLNHIPDGMKMFDGLVAAGCSFWEIAASQAFVTSTCHHELCSIGVYTHNLTEPSEKYSKELTAVLQVLGDMQYARREDIEQIPVLKSRPKHVIYAPLAETSVNPDVVLLFGQARQSLIVTEAIQQVDGGLPPAMGRPACAVIPQVVNTGRAALSLGCCGARAYLSVLTDDVALWGFPGQKIEEYAERIAVLAHANKILEKFHSLRMRDVEKGQKPTYEESLARLQAY